MIVSVPPPPVPGAAAVVSKPPKAWLRWTAVVLCTAGWWLCFDLLRLGYGLAASNPWLQAQCGETPATAAAGDCQTVLASRWSSVPLSMQPGATRIPLAALGMGYFALLGLWYLFVGPPTRDRRAWHVPIALIVLLGGLQSLQLMLVMANVLRQWCVGCTAAHTVNAGLLLLTLLAYPWRRPKRPITSNPTPRLALGALTAGLLAFAAHPLYVLTLTMSNSAVQLGKLYQQLTDDPEFARWHYLRQPHADLPVEDAVAIGRPDAPCTVVLFADFRCPRCRQAHETIEQVRQRYPQQLRLLFRHFPLDRVCNAGLERTLYPHACRAARAAEAAGMVGGAEGLARMSRLLFERQEQLDAANFVEWADGLRLDPGAFATAMSSHAASQRVRADVELARTLGIKAVPVLFLNGRRLDYWRNPATWELLLGGEPTASAAATVAP